VLYQIRTYITFLLKSTNQHGVHSPFVYGLLTKCIYKKNVIPEALKAYRKEQGTTISIKRQNTLYKIARYLSPSEMLVLETSLGIATTALSLANPNGRLTTIEESVDTINKTHRNISRFKLRNTVGSTPTFEAFCSAQTFQKKFDLVYIGPQSKQNMLAYFKQLVPNAQENCVFIFNNMYHNKTVTKAWQKIIADPKVTVSIDGFYLGFVFFRTTQEKQHFTLRL
jgi:predicted O-methyltransferase YrrM